MLSHMSSIPSNVTNSVCCSWEVQSHTYMYCIEVLFTSLFLQFDPENRKNAREIVDLLLPIKKVSYF